MVPLRNNSVQLIRMIPEWFQELIRPLVSGGMPAEGQGRLGKVVPLFDHMTYVPTSLLLFHPGSERFQVITSSSLRIG